MPIARIGLSHDPPIPLDRPGEDAMKQPNITMYGSKTCSDTTAARKYLDDHHIPYEYKDVEDDPSYNDYIADLNGGKRVMPTLRINNETLVNPSLEDLGRAVAKAATD